MDTPDASAAKRDAALRGLRNLDETEAATKLLSEYDRIAGLAETFGDILREVTALDPASDPAVADRVERLTAGFIADSRYCFDQSAARLLGAVDARRARALDLIAADRPWEKLS